MSLTTNFYLGWLFYDMLCAVLLLNVTRHVNKSQNKTLIKCFIFAFLLLAIWGNSISPDYLVYRDIVHEVATTKFPFTHIEAFYIWLIQKLGDNFYLYQTCIYLPSFICIYYIFTKGSKLENPMLFLSLFSILVLYSFIVGRNYVFICVYLTALTLLAHRKYFWSILFLFLSFFLHKLSYIGLPLVLLYFLPLRLSKKNIFILCITFFIALIIVKDILQNQFWLFYDRVSDIQGSNYLLKEEGANAGGSLWWQVIYTYQKTVKYFLAFITLYYLRKFVSLSFFSFNRMMYIILFWTTIISLFIYCIDLPDETIAGRTLSISTIPLCYLISLIPNYVPIRRKHKVIFFLLCFIYLMFNNAYIVGVSHTILR